MLDRNCPLLFTHPERLYTYFQPVTPPVEECLLVPFYVEGKAVGTLWAVAHDDRRKFDAEDRRQLVSLSRFASAAYQAVASVDTVKQLAAIVESSEDAIISQNLVGVITSWNGGAERLYGYSAGEAIGQPITFFIPSDRLDEEASILERFRSEKSIAPYETTRRCKDGTLVDISLAVSSIVDTKGQVIGASKIARNITARKQAETALEEANFQLESRVLDRTTDCVVFITSAALRWGGS